MVYANLGLNQDTYDANPVTDGKKIKKNLLGMVYGLWSIVYGLWSMVSIRLGVFLTFM